MGLWNSFMSLEVKDRLTLIGLAITFTVGLINLFNTRRISLKTGFINSITKERIESMGELKEQMAKYLSLIQNFSPEMLKDEKEEIEFIRAINYRRNKIDFQLNDTNEFEKGIVEDIKIINSVIVLIIKNKSNVPVNIYSELEKYDLSMDKLKTTNQTINSNMDYEKFQDILSEVLDKLSKNLVVSFKTHLKNEWEKIKKEAK